MGVPSRGTGVSRVGRARRAGYWLLAYWLFVIGDLVLCAMCMCMAMCTYCLILKPADQGRAPRKYPRTYPPPPAPPSSCSIMRDAEFHRCVQPMVQPRSAFRIQNEHLKFFVLVLGFRNLGFLVDLDFDVSSDREAMRRNNTVPVNEERCGVAC